MLASQMNISMMTSMEGPGGSQQMYDFISNLFYFGFKRPLIEALKELTKICDG